MEKRKQDDVNDDAGGQVCAGGVAQEREEATGRAGGERASREIGAASEEEGACLRAQLGTLREGRPGRGDGSRGRGGRGHGRGTAWGTLLFVMGPHHGAANQSGTIWLECLKDRSKCCNRCESPV